MTKVTANHVCADHIPYVVYTFLFRNHAMKTAIIVALAMCLAVGGFAQAPAAPDANNPKPAASAATPRTIGPFTFSGSWRLRMEAWDWFDGNANDSYTFAHTTLRFALGQQTRNLDWQVEATVPAVLGAPDDAVAPGAQGQLGLGSTYFVSNGNERNSASIYLSKAFLRFKGFGNEQNRLTLGRFEFIEGTETAPKDKTLAALKTMRIAHRLIGPFSFAANTRSNDGVNLALNTGKANFTFVAARPTRGVFQMDGWGELDVAYAYGAMSIPTGTAKSAGDFRVFAIGYGDERPLTKTDNRPLPARSSALDRNSDIRIGTVGTHYLHAFNTANAGKWDLLLWGAGQFGSWGLQDHRAAAAAAEVGFQPGGKLNPWLRVGFFHGTGDGTANDDEHNTFFQMLPTPRWYARFPFYNFQNNQDLSATLILRPTTKLTLRSEGHALRLSSRNDFWYQGGGAFQPRTFGYVGRPSGGNRGLGNLWDISADFNVTPSLTVTGYFANLWGKGVMKSVYPNGPDARFGYLEFVYRF